MSTSPSSEELRQKLAAIEHERWADWQKWVHDQGKITGDSPMDLLLPEATWKRWQRQIDTPYSSDAEKASDLEQVDRYWPLIEAYVAAERTRLCDELEAGMPEKQPMQSTRKTTVAYAVPGIDISKINDTSLAKQEGMNIMHDQFTALVQRVRGGK